MRGRRNLSARGAKFIKAPKGILTLKADGTYTGTLATPREHQMLFRAPETIEIKGTWKTTEGEIHFHVDEASAMNDSLAGQDATETISKVSEPWFTTIDAKGHEIMYTRVKEAAAGTDEPVEPTRKAEEK